MRLPNIVIIIADDMGYGDPGCYNPHSQVPTPHIDRLAAEGMRFTDAHGPGALCSPSRYGLLTGRYYWRTSKKHALVMPYQPPVIEPGRATLASMLKRQGYQTACVGKWHLGMRYGDADGGYTENEADIDFTRPLPGGPVDVGFDYFFGTAGCSTSDAPYCFIENDRSVGIPNVPSTEDLHALPGFWPGLMAPDWETAHVDERMAEQAVATVHRHADSGSADPFLLYYAPSAPHIPWVTPDFITGVSEDGPRGDMTALYDWCVGQVVAALAERGLRDNTLVICTSDHGPQYHTGRAGHEATAGFRGQKNTAFEGGHRVPLVARWPGHVAAGAVSHEPICHTDMPATLAALTGADLSARDAEDSFNVLGAFLGQGTCEPRPAMVFDTGWHYAVVGDFAVRRDDWKLVLPAGQDDAPQERLLFNLKDDPFEERDLVGEHPQIADDLDRLLGQCRQRGLRQLAGDESAAS